MSKRKVSLVVIGLVIAAGLKVWSDYLVVPIQIKGETVSGIFHHFFTSAIGGFGQTYHLSGTSYDIVWNLSVPILLLLLSAVLLGYITYQVCKSTIQHHGLLFTRILKGIASLVLIATFVNAIVETFHIITLNWPATGMSGLQFAFILCAFFLVYRDVRKGVHHA